MVLGDPCLEGMEEALQEMEEILAFQGEEEGVVWACWPGEGVVDPFCL